MSSTVLIFVFAILIEQNILVTEATNEEICTGNKDKRPHIVFIMADDLGYNDIGYHAVNGMSAVKTPHLDTLAAEGYTLGGGDHYSHNKSFTVESGNVMTTMTGKMLFQNEEPVWEHEGEFSANLFTKRAQTIIRDHDPEVPLFLYLAYYVVHWPLQAPSKYMDIYTNIEDSNRHTYAAMMSALDEGVKNVTNTLEEAGMWNNTVLVFSTDNGGSLRENTGGNNWPLRGGKYSLWEGGVRAVGFVNSPLLSSNVTGTVNKELIHISDWFPTFLDGIAGGNTSLMSKPLDGFNQWDMLRDGGSTSRNDLLLNIDHSQTTKWTNALEKKHWDSVCERYFNDDETFKSLLTTTAGIRSGKWKLLTGPQMTGKWLPPPESNVNVLDLTTLMSHQKCSSLGNMVQLFDLSDDPKEVCNVAYKPENEPVVIDLLKKLHKYNLESMPVFYPPLDPRSDPALHGDAWGPWLDNDSTTLKKLDRIGVKPIFES